jgi:hypothetical protein
VEDQPGGWRDCLDFFGDRFEMDLSRFELGDEADNNRERELLLSRSVNSSVLAEPG